MPEIALHVSDISGFDRSAGEVVVAGDWVSSGFDHAALVSAYRSRADGFDLRMRHTTVGAVPIVAITGANTADCRIRFNLVAGILGSQLDDDYRIGFGDLGWPISRAVAASGTGSGGAVAAVPQAVPALTLPDPGYDLTEVMRHNVREFATLVSRATLLDEFPAQTLRAQWRNACGETAYTIRAVVASVKGAGTFVYSGFTYRLVPGSFTCEQISAIAWNVSLEMENVQL